MAVRPAIVVPLIPAFAVLAFFTEKKISRIAGGATIAAVMTGLPVLWMFTASAGGAQSVIDTTVKHMAFVKAMEGGGRDILEILDTLPSLWFSPVGYAFIAGAFFILYKLFKQLRMQSFVFYFSVIFLHTFWIMDTIRPYNYRYWTILFPVLGVSGIPGLALLTEKIPVNPRITGGAAYLIAITYALHMIVLTFPAVKIQA